MIPIRLSIKEHQRQERLFAAFEYNKEINTIIKSVYGAKWSDTCKQWHFPLTKESVQQIIQLTKEVGTVDVSELRQQLIKRKQLKEENGLAGVEASTKQAILQFRK